MVPVFRGFVRGILIAVVVGMGYPLLTSRLPLDPYRSAIAAARTQQEEALRRLRDFAPKLREGYESLRIVATPSAKGQLERFISSP